MQSRIRKEIFSDRCGDRRHIADMFHHRRKRDRRHYHDRRRVKFAQLERRKSDPGSRRHLREIQDRTSVRVCHSHHLEDCCRCIGDHNAHQNRNNLEHSLAPDIKNDDSSQRDQRNQPVCRCVGDRGRRQ